MPAAEPFSQPIRALGLMSGSSLDGLDLAYCEFFLHTGSGFPQVISWSMGACATLPYSTDWINRLQQATELKGLELTALHVEFGRYIGSLAAQFLRDHDLQPDLVASHGHTVFHYPERAFTLQIGDGAAIAAQTACTTVCDFRSSDIAAGGQGAPLAPLADALLLPKHTFYLNLGGIANLSATTSSGTYIAFDVCGANQILNALASGAGLLFDDEGRLARSGSFLPELAAQQNERSYFSRPYPKSLDNNWVREQQTRFYTEYAGSVADKLHTACRQIAEQIARHIRTVAEREELAPGSLSLLASGGGAYNKFLMECIADALPDIRVEIAEERLIAFKEAALMALMGSLRLLGAPNCLASATGAERDVCGGAVYYGS